MQIHRRKYEIYQIIELLRKKGAQHKIYVYRWLAIDSER